VGRNPTGGLDIIDFGQRKKVEKYQIIKKRSGGKLSKGSGRCACHMKGVYGVKMMMIDECFVMIGSCATFLLLCINKYFLHITRIFSSPE